MMVLSTVNICTTLYHKCFHFGLEIQQKYSVFIGAVCSSKFHIEMVIRGAKETTWHCTIKQFLQINTKINSNISNNTYNAGTKQTLKYKIFRQATHLYSILHASSYIIKKKQSTFTYIILFCTAGVQLQKGTSFTKKFTQAYTHLHFGKTKQIPKYDTHCNIKPFEIQSYHMQIKGQGQLQ